MDRLRDALAIVAVKPPLPRRELDLAPALLPREALDRGEEPARGPSSLVSMTSAPSSPETLVPRTKTPKSPIQSITSSLEVEPDRGLELLLDRVAAADAPPAKRRP